MKAIVFSAYYEPEVAASLYLSTNLYEDMAGSGIDVDLFVPLPTRGVSDEVRNKYKNHKVEVRCNGRLRIHRIGIPKEGKSVIGRAARYILMNAVFILKSISSKADVIFVQSTPPTQGATAAIIKKSNAYSFCIQFAGRFSGFAGRNRDSKKRISSISNGQSY